MTFVVYDYGIRTQTPWYDVLPPRSVDKPKAVAESQSISPNDQIKASNRGAGGSAGDGARSYQRVAQPETQRERIYQVRDLMSSPVITAYEQDSLQTVWQRFQTHKIHHLPVLNAEGQLCGVVSDRDLLQFTSHLLGNQQTQLLTPVHAVMSQQVIVSSPDIELRLLAAAMNSHHIGCMPVMDDSPQLVGIISRSDLLRALASPAPLDLWG